MEADYRILFHIGKWFFAERWKKDYTVHTYTSIGHISKPIPKPLPWTHDYWFIGKALEQGQSYKIIYRF